MTNIKDTQEALLDKLQEVISLSDELHQKKVERLELKVQELQTIVDEFCELMDNSDGVAGLHLNGDIATWRELMNNGWLCNTKDILEQ